MSPKQVKGLPIKHHVPQTNEELNAALGEYFSVKRKLAGFKTRLDNRLKKIKDDYAAKVKPLEVEESVLIEGIQTASEARRAEFTADGTKSQQFAHGTVGWRLGSWYHVLMPTEDGTHTEDDVIAELRQKGLYDTYVVVKPQLDVQKLVRDRHKLGGLRTISFTQDERFYISPPKAKKK